MKSSKDIGKQLAALTDLTPKQLRECYADLYGEPSRRPRATARTL